MNEIFLELQEEFFDFWEDIAETLLPFKKRAPKDISEKTRTVMLYGAKVAVRPAFIFAERVESLLKIFFGISIFVSAIAASFQGMTGLSDLLKFLINSFVGRGLMIVIGFSYFIIGLWKVTRLQK